MQRTNIAQHPFPTVPSELAQFVSEFISNAQPSERAMCVVGVENLKPVLRAMRDLAKEKAQHFDSASALGITHKLIERAGDDPVKSRRALWHVMANLVMHLDSIAIDEPQLTEIAIDVWLMLAESGQYIPNLLRSNIVWTADEKCWFENVKTEREGMMYVIKYSMPRTYKRHLRIKAFADIHKFDDLWFL